MRVVISENKNQRNIQKAVDKTQKKIALSSTNKKGIIVWYAVGFCFIVGMVILYYYGKQYHGDNNIDNRYEGRVTENTVDEIGSELVVEEKDEVTILLDKIGELIDLPNETPTIARIDDVTKISEQPFFANAENGDIVLFYTSIEKAILYRPSTHKIVEVSSIVLE